ncbi:hypothetical protein ACFW81_05205 [Streptomyces angustmyceticus]|uniref:hypothetical protein n=1 Tax=Streptomyces angustmyceticus TaxID=285578 RepID=UPI0036B45069
MWSNYAALGYRRLIYTHTMSVLPDGADPVRRAIGERAEAVRVLLTASDATTADRLAGRERGSELAHETEASVRKACLLDEQTPTDA